VDARISFRCREVLFVWGVVFVLQSVSGVVVFWWLLVGGGLGVGRGMIEYCTRQQYYQFQHYGFVPVSFLYTSFRLLKYKFYETLL